MKINNPVTQQERRIPQGAVLVSRTDLKGTITYANRDFVEASGYSEQELLGRNHNIVRHPDMPAAAFQDLWETIKAGKPWTGIVKNRAKNGDHYWVSANVVPVSRNGSVAEYLSVRTPATAEQVAAAETLYADVDAGRTRLGRQPLWSRMNLLRNASVWQRLALVLALLIVPFGIQMGSYVRVQQEQMATTARELRGVDYLVPLRLLTQHLATHRGASLAFLEGRSQFGETMRTAAERIDDVFRSPVANDPAREAELQVAEDWDALKKRWASLRDRVRQIEGPRSFAEHTALVESVRDLMGLVGDRSALVLDPELDSFYVMDALVNNLPEVLERLGIVRGKTAGLLANPADGDAKRAELRQLIARAEASLGRVAKDVAVAVRENPALADRIEESANDFLGAARLLLGDIRISVIEAAQPTADPATVFTDSTRTIEQGFALYDALVPVLQGLLEARIERLRSGIAFSVVTGLSFLALALLLSFVVIRGITGPLKVAVRAFHRLEEGDFTHPVPFDNAARDEVSDLLRELKKMQTKLGFDVMDARERAAASLRIQQALDSVASPVTVSDAQHGLIYLNGAARALFSSLADGIREHVPDFDPEHMPGMRIGTLFTDPELRQRYSAALDGALRTRTVLGGRSLDLVASPVRDAEGRYQGRVTQWTDVTETLRAEAEEAERLAEERRQAEENLRIRTALDNVSSSVMVADTDRRIIYLNRTAQQLFRGAESDIRSDLPAFSADRLLGASIDDFHESPGHQARVLAELSAPHQSGMRLGGRELRIVANPVIDAAGKRLGTAVEWTDRTAEVAVEREIDAIVEAARAGDLGRRIAMEGKSGFFHQLAGGINALLGVIEASFRDIGQVMSGMADGDLTAAITADYEGTFGKAKDDVNRTLLTLSQMVGRLRDAADAVATASNQISAGNTNLSARTEQQAASLQETASSMEELTSCRRRRRRWRS